MPDFCSALDGAKDTKAFVGDRQLLTHLFLQLILNTTVLLHAHIWTTKTFPYVVTTALRRIDEFIQRNFFLFGHTGINTAEVYVNHGCR